MKKPQSDDDFRRQWGKIVPFVTLQLSTLWQKHVFNEIKTLRKVEVFVLLSCFITIVVLSHLALFLTLNILPEKIIH